MRVSLLLLCTLLGTPCLAPLAAQTLDLTLRFQQPTSENSPNFHRLQRRENWRANETAVIVCDMWDSHHCVNAVRRVVELAPRIDAFCRKLRNTGVTIIHAPSSCVGAYEKHPARLRAQSIPLANSMPDQIDSWCDQIPSEESAAYPVDQSAGGEDDDRIEHLQWEERLVANGKNPRAPWTRQIATISIDDDQDFLSDSGREIWSILESEEISNVILVGVHTNMCVLGRPFGLRRLASAGKNVVLARDLTDTMIDPKAWPYASHFTGTDLIISHIERYVCPTISGDQVLGGNEFRFSADRRVRLAMLIAEDEYQTHETLPKFAAKHLSEHFSVQVCFGSESTRHQIVGLDDLQNADAILVSVRRRALPQRDLQTIRNFVAQAKPVIGIRTASHAFSLRGKPAPKGTAVWPNFDAEVFGGNYTGHHANDLTSALRIPEHAVDHPILQATQPTAITPGGSLYKTSPLASGTQILIQGHADGQPAEPVAWTFVRNDGGRSFYTSLGHPTDFAQPAFEALLAGAIHWTCGLEPHRLAEIEKQNQRYAAGQGRQRK